MSTALEKLHLATIAPAVGSPPSASRAATAAATVLAALALPRRAGHAAQALEPAPRTDGHRPPPPERWSHAALAGRVVELSAARASATLTLAVGLVREAQRKGEPVAWVSDDRSGFYPPDAAANGVDLAALAIVRLPHGNSTGARLPHGNAARVQHNNSATAARPPHGNSNTHRLGGANNSAAATAARTSAYGNSAIARAAERLARSGAFGLIVLDLGARAVIPAPLQGLLNQHAQRHAITILCLTEKAASAPSLGSLISLRGQAKRQRAGGGAGAAPGRFVATLAITKDKRRGPGWSHEEPHRGPPGLR